MQAIDFHKLLREEKKGRKSNRRKENGENEKQFERSLAVPSWGRPSGSLCFSILDLQRICDNPASISYSRAVFKDTSELERWLIELPEGNSGISSWKTMPFGKRRVAMFGDNGDPLPPPFGEIAEELVSCGVFPESEKPNHVLCNDYQPSQGILPHTDGPRYASRTATISLCSDVVMSFTRRLKSNQIGDPNCEQPLQVLLESGSLLAFEGAAYTDYCHGIEMDVWHDETSSLCLNAEAHQIIQRARRFSLTFRHMPPANQAI